MLPRRFLFTDSGHRPRERYDFLSTNRAKERTILFLLPSPCTMSASLPDKSGFSMGNRARPRQNIHPV